VNGARHLRDRHLVVPRQELRPEGVPDSTDAQRTQFIDPVGEGPQQAIGANAKLKGWPTEIRARSYTGRAACTSEWASVPDMACRKTPASVARGAMVPLITVSASLARAAA